MASQQVLAEPFCEKHGYTLAESNSKEEIIYKFKSTGSSSLPSFLSLSLQSITSVSNPNLTILWSLAPPSVSSRWQECYKDVTLGLRFLGMSCRSQQQVGLQHQVPPVQGIQTSELPSRNSRARSLATVGLTVHIPESGKRRLEGHRQEERVQRAPFSQHSQLCWERYITRNNGHSCFRLPWRKLT